MHCDEMDPEDWIERFTGHCYFYPARDCPGWEPGGSCGRVGLDIPLDEEDDDG